MLFQSSTAFNPRPSIFVVYTFLKVVEFINLPPIRIGKRIYDLKNIHDHKRH